MLNIIINFIFKLDIIKLIKHFINRLEKFELLEHCTIKESFRETS